MNALNEQPFPVYGDGRNVRDWLYVEDHCRGIEAVLMKGRLGETYNIGGGNEWQHIDVVRLICNKLDELRPATRPRRELITFVKDRPGHDLRYAIGAGKVTRELGWSPKKTFEVGIDLTLDWNIKNQQGWLCVK